MKKNHFYWLIISGFLLFSLGFFANYFLAHQLLFDEMQNILQGELTRISADLRPILLHKKQINKAKSYLSDYYFNSDGYCFLTDSNGKILAASETASFINRTLLILDKKEIIPWLLQINKNNFKALGKGETFRFVAAGKIPNTAYSVAMVLPFSSYQKAVKWFIYKLFLIWFMAFLLLWFLIIWTHQKVDHVLTILNNFLERLGNKEQLQDNDLEFESLPYFKENLLKISNNLIQPEAQLDNNPLTGLLGNNELQKQLFLRIDQKAPMAICYVNIDHFTSFNQRYGFTKGDSIIRLLGLFITNILKESGNSDDFAAHLGADQFVFITTPDKVDLACSSLIENFDREIPFYYPEEDRKRSYILSKNRQGEIKKFPFITVSVAVVTNEKRALIHPLQIGKIASEIKHFLQSKSGSNYMKDRRTEDRELSSPEDANNTPQT